ncbi:hypothetical protein SETIT_3G346900v2 [Setaria italica]|uniref:Uncharacterized protein n=2 Tax=Setaria TaxID=4554 RepID=K3ZBB9_SETIT|nr:hypothetical protein SETIT_3G346900v2 [Setaria italica]TKW28945.1 hypothetical protein SEVIR_3G362500v2 [Setaria viridis]
MATARVVSEVGQKLRAMASADSMPFLASVCALPVAIDLNAGVHPLLWTMPSLYSMKWAQGYYSCIFLEVDCTGFVETHTT